MVGLIQYTETAGLMPRRPSLNKRRIHGITFLETEIYLPKNPARTKAARKAMMKAAKKLRLARVNRYIGPAGPFPFETLLENQGLWPVSQARLFQAMAVPLTLRLLKEEGQDPKRSVVALCGERTSALFERIAVALSAEVRNLAIDAAGSLGLCWRLRREYGLPVLEGGAGMAEAAATLLFSPPLQGREAYLGSGPILYFGSDPPGVFPNRRLIQSAGFTLREGEVLPEAWDRSGLVSLLLEQGRIGLGDIEIEQLS